MIMKHTAIRLPSPAIVLGYTVAVVMALTGIAVIAGLVMRQGVPDRFRITFGVVLALMGVYRSVLTRTKQMRIAREKEEEEE
ncbi:MAG: hypothetical protein A2X67_05690 [Ignavibacteria bacterium GWA2_55_11]|nr:MAG: hypothetical protein A2X67_05690 [Ignavibacteria bacterium GWA2_55_11]OGU44136.1 MAG: hypothetical protein A2X68_10760 [Ignavibacteria bacterium GWC2_56_12]OGU76972.1 MAG: hypothetical protein A3G43_10430 [Ignavibacteria bacterium RIFCSPLOWO2_12_FULL_56_21]